MIVGREPELETLGAFLRAGGDAVLALIEGEAGIGKTTLWSAVIEAARADGATVLVARPTAAETASAYAALDDLVRPAVGLLPRVPEVPRHALSTALLLEPATGPLELRAVGAGFELSAGESKTGMPSAVPGAVAARAKAKAVVLKRRRDDMGTSWPWI